MSAAECSAPMRAIVDALVALAAVVPTACNVSVDGGRVTFQCHSDEGVRHLAALFGIDVRSVCFEGATWLAANSNPIVAVSVAIFGPHHKVSPAIDEEAVAAALDQANAAIAGASS